MPQESKKELRIWNLNFIDPLTFENTHLSLGVYLI